MQSNSLRRFSSALTALLNVSIFAASGLSRTIGAEGHPLSYSSARNHEASAVESSAATYQWKLGSNDAPLLELNAPSLAVGFEQGLSYPAAAFDFLIFKSLTLNEEHDSYLLPIRSGHSQTFMEFSPTAVANSYLFADGSELQDRGTTKSIIFADGTRYLFVRYPDDQFKCAMIRDPQGRTLNLVYSANGLLLHGVVDSIGRTLTFNYRDKRIESVTQNWMAEARGFTKTWTVGDDKRDGVSSTYAHAVFAGNRKFIPANALVEAYTEEMAASDKLLAQIFGGPNAVAAGNGFEPGGLDALYPFYRGDLVGDDGKVRHGHLSYAMHIYGSPDGTGESQLYVPAGFTAHSSNPSRTDSAVTFYYPRLGKLTDVTLAVFHVADFQIVPEGERVRIGKLGGPGGSSALYKHSHVEFYRGNVGLPTLTARAALRIEPASIFAR